MPKDRPDRIRRSPVDSGARGSTNHPAESLPRRASMLIPEYGVTDLVKSDTQESGTQPGGGTTLVPPRGHSRRVPSLPTRRRPCQEPLHPWQVTLSLLNAKCWMGPLSRNRQACVHDAYNPGASGENRRTGGGAETKRRTPPLTSVARFVLLVTSRYDSTSASQGLNCPGGDWCLCLEPL